MGLRGCICKVFWRQKEPVSDALFLDYKKKGYDDDEDIDEEALNGDTDVTAT